METHGVRTLCRKIFASGVQIMTTNTKRDKRRRGQALVESALVLISFVAMLIGALDFSQILFFHQSLGERVRSGVRWGAVHAFNGIACRCCRCRPSLEGNRGGRIRR